MGTICHIRPVDKDQNVSSGDAEQTWPPAEGLAEMAGVTESAVRNYELGLRTPRPQHLEALARALGVDPPRSPTTGSRRRATRLRSCSGSRRDSARGPRRTRVARGSPWTPRRPAPRSSTRRSGRGPRCARGWTPGRSPRRSTSTGSAGSSEGRFRRLRGRFLSERE